MATASKTARMSPAQSFSSGLTGGSVACIRPFTSGRVRAQDDGSAHPFIQLRRGRLSSGIGVHTLQTVVALLDEWRWAFLVGGG